MKWLNKNKILHSSLVKNSIWGLLSNFLQTLFVSLFFIIVARKYSPNEFAQFLIATTVYQLVAAFSSMGLGQWFIRQYDVEDDKLTFTGKFLKTQVGLGILFYAANIVFAYALYPLGQIRILCIVLGTNVIFDNFINAIKSLNIAEFRQRKTSSILVIDGFLKLLVGGLLFVLPFSTLTLAVLMIVVRILTLGLFIKVGSANTISLMHLWDARISYQDLKSLILRNWQFMVIGSISIIYWRLANVVISKMLTLTDVANYEIAYRVFSVIQIVPVIASATIYPQFIKYFNQSDYTGLRRFYHTIVLVYTIFAVSAYAFVYTFSPAIIPLAFGNGYPGAILCLQQMFLTFLLLPTVLLQANLIVAIGLEVMDMKFNIISLLVNMAGCLIGLYFVKSLSVINYSILFSFAIFHVLQNILLVRKKMTETKYCIAFYSSVIAFVLFYQYMSEHFRPYPFFISVSAVAIIGAIALFSIKGNPLNYLGSVANVVPDK